MATPLTRASVTRLGPYASVGSSRARLVDGAGVPRLLIRRPVRDMPVPTGLTTADRVGHPPPTPGAPHTGTTDVDPSRPLVPRQATQHGAGVGDDIKHGSLLPSGVLTSPSMLQASLLGRARSRALA